MGKGMLGGRRPLIVGALAVLLVVPAILFASSQPGAAASTVLTIIDGQTQVARGSADFTPATDGQLRSGGDRVRTEAASHALYTVLINADVSADGIFFQGT